jgi:hypothetical protein
MARLRCRLGLHRWEYDSSLVGERGVELEVIRARCRDGCARFGAWRLVEQRPYDEQPRPAVDEAPETAGDVIEPA